MAQMMTSKAKVLPAQWKIVSLVLLVSLGTISAVVWKTQNLILDDKLGFIAESSAKQLAPLKRLIQVELSEAKNFLVQFAVSRTTNQPARTRSFRDFDVVAMVQPAANPSEGGSWHPAWIEKSATVSADRWPAGYEQTLLQSLPYAKVRDGETTWVRVSDPKGLPIYALMFSVEVASSVAKAADASAANAVPTGALPEKVESTPVGTTGTPKKSIVVGFTSVAPLVSASEDYIGAVNTAFIVDERGYVASHPNKAYLGALFSEDPLVQQIVKTQKTSGTGQFEDLESQRVMGRFERIDRTNLYAVITTPMAAAEGLMAAHLRTALITGAGVGLLGLLLAWLVGRSLAQQTQNAPRASAENESPATNEEPIAAGGVAESTTGVVGAESLPEPRGAEISFERLAAERRAAYEAFSEGLGSSVREPLLAVLGHAQLVRAKADDPEIIAHAESIERDARLAKAVVERLRGFGLDEVDAQETEPVELESVVRSALAKIESDLAVEGIELERALAKVPKIRGSAAEIEFTLNQLIENAREAMQARGSKKLKVELSSQGERVILKVTDNGIGMARDEKARAFEPFYKGFASAKRMGLGLSFVQAAMKNHQGECEIDSVPGEGTTVTLKFPVAHDLLFAPERVPSLDTIFPVKPSVDETETKKSTEPRITLDAEDTLDLDETIKPFMAPLANLELEKKVSFEESAPTPSVEDKTVVVAPNENAQVKLTASVSEALSAAKAAAALWSDDDDDDAPDAFSNMPLSRMGDQGRASEAPIASSDAPVAKSEGKNLGDGFKVKVRRPRPRV
jgi:signal transduction histidine kinase